MPKDTRERRYLNPAIPRTSRLLAYLEQTSAETGIAESQLLVLFASEYIRLIVDGAGGVPVVPSPVPSQAPVGVGLTSSLRTSPEQTETQGSMRTLEHIDSGGDENFESFGDPD